MNVRNVRTSEIVVPSGRRQLRGVDDVAASIAEVGLLNPISVAPAREHSRKPDAFYRLVEDLCPAGYGSTFSRGRA